MKDGTSASRFFSLYVRYRGTWEALEREREMHHLTEARFRQFIHRAFWDAVCPERSPHLALERCEAGR